MKEERPRHNASGDPRIESRAWPVRVDVDTATVSVPLINGGTRKLTFAVHASDSFLDSSRTYRDIFREADHAHIPDHAAVILTQPVRDIIAEAKKERGIKETFGDHVPTGTLVNQRAGDVNVQRVYPKTEMTDRERLGGFPDIPFVMGAPLMTPEELGVTANDFMHAETLALEAIAREFQKRGDIRTKKEEGGES